MGLVVDVVRATVFLAHKLPLQAVVTPANEMNMHLMLMEVVTVTDGDGCRHPHQHLRKGGGFVNH